MIRALIAWALKSWLAKSLPKSAALVTSAILSTLDEIRERGEDAVVVDKSGARPRVLFKPADPGAKPVSLDDILKSENNPAG